MDCVRFFKRRKNARGDKPEEAHRPHYDQIQAFSPKVLQMLWTNHKLEAVDTPFGTCLQRAKGNCTFAKQPPCLICNGGSPCKDLCIGAFEGDIEKYELLIASSTALIEQAKRYGREKSAEENQALLQLYQRIHETICTGNVIYSRMDRLVGA